MYDKIHYKLKKKKKERKKEKKKNLCKLIGFIGNNETDSDFS